MKNNIKKNLHLAVLPIVTGSTKMAYVQFLSKMSALDMLKTMSVPPYEKYNPVMLGVSFLVNDMPSTQGQS